MTRFSKKSLRLRRGDDALAIIKSTEVTIAKSGGPASVSKRRPRATAVCRDGSTFALRASADERDGAPGGLTDSRQGVVTRRMRP